MLKSGEVSKLTLSAAVVAFFDGGRWSAMSSVTKTASMISDISGSVWTIFWLTGSPFKTCDWKRDMNLYSGKRNKKGQRCSLEDYRYIHQPCLLLFGLGIWSPRQLQMESLLLKVPPRSVPAFLYRYYESKIVIRLKNLYTYLKKYLHLLRHWLTGQRIL